MIKQQQHTAILVFARSAKAEGRVKRFAAVNGRKNQKIAERLLRHSLSEAKQSGLPVIHLSETDQQGETFGERLAHAFETVYTQGYSRVIAIGSDCPQLTSRHLQKAALQLQTQNIVLGPSSDGGVYLIGLTAQAFDKKQFCQMSWQNRQVFEVLLAHYESAKCSTLPIEEDLDQWHQLGHLLDKFELASKLYRQLIRILNPVNNPEQRNAQLSIVPYLSFPIPHRGPPLYC